MYFLLHSKDSMIIAEARIYCTLNNQNNVIQDRYILLLKQYLPL